MLKQMSVPILAMGNGWIAVDKPCNLSIHNDPGGDLCSILKRDAETRADIRGQLKYDSAFGFHAVHRLDKETSGVILLACNSDIFRYYSKQFESGNVQKRYTALLHGTVPGDENAWGLWDWQLSKDAGGRDCPAGRGKTVRCATRFRILAQGLRYTLVECELLTGRKHQIRRHAKLAGYPVVGDSRYGTRRSVNYLREHLGFSRLGLHSSSLTIQTPDQKSPLTIQSPEIPSEILQLLAKKDLRGFENLAGLMIFPISPDGCTGLGYGLNFETSS
jgi:23S rRNA-/tRNA-specific pseudouridylate synthase